MKLTRVIVIGAGDLGQEMARWFAEQMCFVELVDASSERLVMKVNAIHSFWDKLVERKMLDPGRVNQMKKLIVAGPLEYVNTSPDLVIEAIEEGPEVRAALFSQLDFIFSTPAVFATTSTPGHEESISNERKHRFVGIHFQAPDTVNVIKGKETSDEIYRELCQWFENRGNITSY